MKITRFITIYAILLQIMVITIKVESTIIVIKLPVKQKQKNRSLIFANFCFNRVIFINFVKTLKS